MSLSAGLASTNFQRTFAPSILVVQFPIVFGFIVIRGMTSTSDRLGKEDE